MKIIGKLLLSIFDGIAKALAFILISLGLWLSTLFTVAFFIVCGATGTALSSGIMAVFWLGLGVTAFCGFALSMYMRSRRKQKLAERREAEQYAGQTPAEKKKRGKSRGDKDDRYVAPQAQWQNAPPPQNPYMNNQYAQMQNGYMPPQGYPYSGDMNYSRQPDNARNYSCPPVAPYVPPAEPPKYDKSDLDRKYFGADPAHYERTASFDESTVPQSYGRTMTKTQQKEADSRFDSDELWRRLSGANVPDEQPLVFRTRKDPDLYVYEYSDRYQYWRRTRTGMVFENTEFKNK